MASPQDLTKLCNDSPSQTFSAGVLQSCMKSRHHVTIVLKSNILPPTLQYWLPRAMATISSREVRLPFVNCKTANQRQEGSYFMKRGCCQVNRRKKENVFSGYFYNDAKQAQTKGGKERYKNFYNVGVSAG